MNHCPDHRIQQLLGMELPIIQAPMTGVNLSAMAISVSQAGGLGSLPCAMLSADQMRAQLEAIRRRRPSAPSTAKH
jgi:nitronate monooxygenase